APGTRTGTRDRPTRPGAPVSNRPGLALDPGQEDRLTVALQSFLEESPKHDLKAHRKLESDRRLSRDDPGLVQDLAGQNEKHPGAIFVHRHLPPIVISVIFV